MIQLALPSPAGELDVNTTVTFLEQWRRVSLPVSERRATRTALAQIHNNLVHPCLGKRQMPNDRIEPAWMASPCPDVTITWTGMWNDPATPVLLTLTSLTDSES